MRHYTINKVRWLSKLDNVANKSLKGKNGGSLLKSSKDVVCLLHSCKRANYILSMEMLGALSRGYDLYLDLVVVYTIRLTSNLERVVVGIQDLDCKF